MSCVVLVGMPGAGKSTVGKALAAKLKVGYIDTDDMLAVRTGKAVHDLIQELGVEDFAELEGQVVKSLEAHDCVIATGGSVVMHTKAMDHLKKLGKVVFVDAPLRDIIDRVGGAVARGVAGAHNMSIKQIYEMRRPVYMEDADLVISNGEGEDIPEEAVAKIRKWLYA